MRKRYQPQIQHNHEFEIDLAPLLAVMVKLVPVLLISSAFVQVMVVETELPKAVQAAIEKKNNDEIAMTVNLSVKANGNMDVILEKQGEVKQTENIAAKSDGSYDLENLQTTLQKIKGQLPKVYHLEMRPEATVSYKNIVKIMDEARKSRNPEIKFPVWDEQKNQETETDYMFPDVSFEISEG